MNDLNIQIQLNLIACEFSIDEIIVDDYISKNNYDDVIEFSKIHFKARNNNRRSIIFDRLYQ
jgi:hypothetical protein